MTCPTQIIHIRAAVANSVSFAPLQRNPAEKGVDLEGQVCEVCHQGKYRSTSLQDDWQGILHCSACGHYTKRNPIENKNRNEIFQVKDSEREFSETEKEQLTQAFQYAYHGLADKMPLFIFELINTLLLEKKIDESYLQDFFQLRIRKEVLQGQLEVLISQIQMGRLEITDLKNWLVALQRKE